MSGTINIVSKTQRLIVDIPTRSVFVMNAGPVGPPGMTAPLESRIDDLETIISQLNTRVAELEVIVHKRKKPRRE